MPSPFSLIFGQNNQQKQPDSVIDDDDDDAYASDVDTSGQDLTDIEQPEPFYDSDHNNLDSTISPHRKNSVADILSLSQHSTPLLPNRIAKMVSAVSKGSTMSLRLGTYIASTMIDSARIGTLTSLGFTRRAIEGIIYKADQDTENAESWT